MKDLFP